MLRAEIHELRARIDEIKISNWYPAALELELRRWVGEDHVKLKAVK